MHVAKEVDVVGVAEAAAVVGAAVEVAVAAAVVDIAEPTTPASAAQHFVLPKKKVRFHTYMK